MDHTPTRITDPPVPADSDGQKTPVDDSAGSSPSIDALGTLPVSDGETPSTAPPETLPASEAVESLPEIEGYEIIEVLGRGGMGVVYKARDVNLGREVAIKMIVSGPIAGESMRNRFDSEARAVAQLQHTHIAQLYTAATFENRPYFVMEYVGGGTLASRIRGNPLSPNEGAALLVKLAEAVEFSHGRGIIHRDLKPGNVLLTTEGEPKIADFGLAKWIDRDSSSTKTGDIIGTPSYMAPEQAGGVVKSIGPPCDVYALGAILYELLTGRPPFRTPEPLQTVMLVLSEDPVPPRRLQPTVSRDLETICLKCLEKPTARRYATAGELAADLRRYLSDEPILARPVGRTERLLKWIKRRPATATIIALVFLGLVAGLGGALFHSRRMEDALAETEVERDKFRAERDRAQRLFQSGRELSKTLLEEHLTALEGLAGGLRVQEQLAKQLVAYLDKLSKDAEDDTVLLADLADWYERVAKVQGNPYQPNRGASAEALDNYRKALAFRERLLERQPNALLPRLQHAVCRKSIADVQFQRGKVNEARTTFEELQRYLAALRKEHPKDNRVLAAQIETIGAIADADVWNAKLESGLKRYRRALALCDEFIPSTAEKRAVHQEFRMLQHLRIGEILEQLTRADEAETHFRKVHAHRKKQYDENPKDALQQMRYASILIKLADIETRRRRFDAARKLYLQALPIYRYLANQDPDNDGVHGILSQILSRVGFSFLQEPTKDVKAAGERALPFLKEAGAIRQRLADKAAVDIERLRNLGVVQRQLATACARAGRGKQAEKYNLAALKTAKRQEKLVPHSPDAMELRAECQSGLAVIEAERGMQAAVEGKASLARGHFDSCIEYFKQSQATWKDYDKRHKLDARTRQLCNTVDRLRTYLEQQIKRIESKLKPTTKTKT